LLRREPVCGVNPTLAVELKVFGENILCPIVDGIGGVHYVYGEGKETGCLHFFKK